MKKILLVEDDRNINESLNYFLQLKDFFVVSSFNIKEARKKININNFDLILMDITLPDGNGYDFFEEIKTKEIPVIFLTALDEENDIVKGLEKGAEDYIVKPFKPNELIARINKVFKKNNKNDKIYFKNITIDVNYVKVYKEDKEIYLSNTEYKILLFMIKNKNRIITKNEILDLIWDSKPNENDLKCLPVYIKRLREKIEDDIKNPKIIKTIRKKGYIVKE